MTIKEQLISFYQKQILDIKAYEESQVAQVKDKVVREKITPYNQELDQSRARAEAELVNNLNANIKALQEQFAKDKQALFEAGEKKKTEHFNSIMANETYNITSECEKQIAKINSLINDLKE